MVVLIHHRLLFLNAPIMDDKRRIDEVRRLHCRCQLVDLHTELEVGVRRRGEVWVEVGPPAYAVYTALRLHAASKHATTEV